jgi:hypothetical protein
MTKASTGPNRNTAGPGSRRGASCAVVAAAVISGFLGGTVVNDGLNLSVSDNIAFAKGGNGRGGGHGGGNTGGRGDPTGVGKGLGHAKNQGHARAGSSADNQEYSGPPGAPSVGKKSAFENGISAAALGSLNAAHASLTARQNASPNSMVGHIAAFADAVESENINAAAEALAAKANRPITDSVVTEVARHAQVEVSEETASAIAARAAEIQADESQEPIGQSMPGGS